MNYARILYKDDLQRYGGKIDIWSRLFLHAFRNVTTYKNGLKSLYYKIIFRIISRKHGMEISSDVVIGKGLYIGHPYNVTINPNASLGNNINIHKGVTIGQENRGKRKGAPIIGDRVWIGVNSSIVGRIVIGDDVLIAPNSYVNCDVPSHSIVVGNPCVIIHRENATDGYVNNIV